MKIKSQLLDKADGLIDHLEIGQLEDYLVNLNKGHRRLVEGNYKIIYRIVGEVIYITDFFDTRQYPKKMKG